MRKDTGNAPTLPGWTEPVSCPSCHDGYVTKRYGPFGHFYGCTSWPACAFKTDDYGINQLLDPDYSEPFYGG